MSKNKDLEYSIFSPDQLCYVVYKLAIKLLTRQQDLLHLLNIFSSPQFASQSLKLEVSDHTNSNKG